MYGAGSERQELLSGLSVQSSLSDTSSVQHTQKSCDTNFLVGLGSMRTNMHEGCKATRFCFRSSLHNRQRSALRFGRLQSNHHFPPTSFLSTLDNWGFWGFRTGAPFWHTHHVCESRLRGYDYDVMISFYVSYFFLPLFLFLLWAKLCIFTKGRERKITFH